ncbi:MAG TPA: EAL domain-containing protein [Actinomycetes bacterium]|nr:EAL domain-containing protein [Actinomycetes bacterium]
MSGTAIAGRVRLTEPTLTRAFYVVFAATLTVFVVSTIPGVRSHPGYNLILDGWLNNICYMLSPVLCWIRARKATAYQSAWKVLAVGLAVYGLGNVYWTIFVRPLDPEPFPSPADALWLSFGAFAFVALVLVVRDIADRVPLSLWLDGAVGGLAVGAVSAAIVGPVLSVTGGSPSAVLTTLAYPLLDILLMLVVTAVLAMFHWRPPRGLWFFMGGLMLFAVADGAYLIMTAHNSYQPGGPDDAIWVLATVLMALAPGWTKGPTGVALPAWLLLGIPIAATVCSVALLVWGTGKDRYLHPVAVFLAAGTVVMAMGRLIVSFREVSTLAHSHQLALTDELTGLGNRRAFYEQVERRLNAAPHVEGALLLLDLDRFKEVNDSLGHHAGDNLLCHVSQRIAGCLIGVNDVLARLGGDEFAVFLVGVDVDAAERVAQRIHDALTPPFSVDGVTVRVEASIGVSLVPAHGQEVSTLLRRADIAMYQAKQRRIGHWVYSADSDSTDGQDRLRTLEELREAVYSRTLTVHYQPKVDSRTSVVRGVEALVRWQHPVRGLLYPAAFLPLAEDAGLMRELTTAVLEQSMDQVMEWRRQGRMLTVAVNLSASSLVDLELPDRICSILFNRRLPSECLELEITEDFLMGDRERAREILTQLRGLGIRVAVDDFGTGYSSLAYLRELPIDELKLDRSFVQPMSEDSRAAAIVRSTIGLAHSLGMTLVAEGVEDEATASHLASSGCDASQGYYYARPLPSAELEAWLDRHGAPALATQATPTTAEEIVP